MHVRTWVRPSRVTSNVLRNAYTQLRAFNLVLVVYKQNVCSVKGIPEIFSILSVVFFFAYSWEFLNFRLHDIIASSRYLQYLMVNK